MIYSGFESNYKRVGYSYSIARQLDERRLILQTEKTQKKLGNLSGISFQINDINHELNCIVEAIVTWVVIAIEALTNQAIAEKINNHTLAVAAIERPRETFGKFLKLSDTSPELLYKVALLADRNGIESTMQKRICDIVSLRNRIVHDKPFYFEVYGEGEEIFFPFSKRDKENSLPSYSYSQLNELFSDADSIVEFIAKHGSIEISECRFLEIPIKHGISGVFEKESPIP